MAIALDDSARTTLRSLFVEVVETAQVTFRQYVSLERTPIQRVFARLRDIVNKRKLDAPWLTSRAISEFLTDRLEERVRAANTHTSTAGPLIGADGFADSAEIAAELLDALSTLPWRYRLMLPMPFGKPVNEDYESTHVSLGDEYRLETYDAAAAKAIVLRDIDEHDAAFRHRTYPTTVASDTVYFVSDAQGYIPMTEASAEIDEFVHAWKGLIGLLAVDQSLVRTFTHELGPPPPSLPVVIHRLIDDGKSEAIPYKWLSLEDTRLLVKFAATDRLVGNLNDAVAAIRPAFDHAPTRSAARWYLDSLSDDRSVLQVVQATMSLEILLGDEDESDELGLTSLLANRLAFLTERSPRRRDQVLAAFKRLYKIRSRIVHAGKASLADDERSALYDLQRLAFSAISSQISGFRSY
jgi:hypothetical protein